MNDKELINLLEDAATRIGEHVDAVQIMVTMGADGGGTRCFKRGSGNWYARQGMAHEFIQEEMSRETASAISDKIAPPPDDEEWKTAE